MSKIHLIKGGVTAAEGFSAGGISAGIKTGGGHDLGVIFSEKKCTAAGTFTTNRIRASCVQWCSSQLPSSAIQAVVCNSGCANACTGKRGERDTAMLADRFAEELSVEKTAVLIASTGVIGEYLPMESIRGVIPALCSRLNENGGTAFAKAILTTDLVKKEAAVTVQSGKDAYVIGGCAKGSGMICPNMATMLGFITTDAVVTRAKLDPMVRRVVDRTFNNLTVDGDTSTNDMVLVMANGMSGVKVADAKTLSQFEEALYVVCNDLCSRIAADGEGATKRVEITVRGAQCEDDAKRAAKAVANSNLTKCALFGNDPNWGRIACAVGYSGAVFSDKKMSIRLCGVPVFRNVQPVPFDKKKIYRELRKKTVAIDVDLAVGGKSAVAHTCDFSYDYVKINAEYHT
jgi:glutamate N-acetyltransferase / amino-acid N-acetyltransferase